MHFAIVNAPPGTQGKPYRFYKFRTLNTANKCSEVDEFALVYESSEQLKQLCPTDDIRAIVVAMGHEVPENANHDALVRALHRLVENEAVSWSTTQTEEPEVATKKAPKKAAKPKVAKEKKERKSPLQAKFSGKLTKSGKIKKLAPNPARAGTRRHLNLEVIYNSKTVEDALRDLRNLTTPGGMVDIRFAVANGLIEIIDNG
jgi:hypothetical protein